MSQSKSGLRTFTREFNSSQETEILTSSWTPTSEASRASFADLKNLASSSSNKPLSTSDVKGSAIQSAEGRVARLNAISAALATHSESMSANAAKRSSPSDYDSAPSKRKRLLPWHSASKPSVIDLESITSNAPSASGVPKPSTATSPDFSSSRPSKPAAIFLSAEQRQILKLVQQGHNIFYTGSAGTGKSVLLREIIKALRFKHAKSPDAIAITASTGIAACNVGGMTIHSFAGIGLGIENAEQLATKVRKNRKAMGRWQRTKVLIIDEVSMVDGDLFDKLASIACILRRSAKPFGGIQLVVTGDFFQLPPVTRGEPKFAFEADMWSECIPKAFKLTKVFRQQDPGFVDMLNEMRFGTLSQKSIKRFKELSRVVSYPDGIEPTELFPRRENVDNSNYDRNKSLKGDVQSYRAHDGGTMLDIQQRDKLLQNCMYPERLDLKIGSQVMLIKNHNETLVNGSLGKVITFTDGRNMIEGGAGNAADSADSAKKAKARVGERLWPLVRFGDERTGIEMLVQSETWKSELPSGEVQASRTQLPLILSWAMSIHKSQGQTLDRVKVDLGRVFEKGQAYVALSRATSLDRLQVLNFDERKVMVHPKVVEWSATLKSIEE